MLLQEAYFSTISSVCRPSDPQPSFDPDPQPSRWKTWGHLESVHVWRSPLSPIITSLQIWWRLFIHYVMTCKSFEFGSETGYIVKCNRLILHSMCFWSRDRSNHRPFGFQYFPFFHKKLIFSENYFIETKFSKNFAHTVLFFESQCLAKMEYCKIRRKNRLTPPPVA
jgi:hypothetical protein